MGTYQSEISFATEDVLSNFEVELSEDELQRLGGLDGVLGEVVLVPALLGQDVLVDVSRARLHAVLVATRHLEIFVKNLISSSLIQIRLVP